MFFGKTGVGKTTLLNVLFGLGWPTDPVSCTVEPTVARIRRRDFPGLNRETHTVLDVAGIAESLAADREHLDGYETWAARASRIIYITQADTRAHKQDQRMILRLRRLFRPGVQFILALSRVDQLGSDDEGACQDGLSAAQLRHLPDKVGDVFGAGAEGLAHLVEQAGRPGQRQLTEVQVEHLVGQKVEGITTGGEGANRIFFGLGDGLQEQADFREAHVAWVPLVVEQDEAAAPISEGGDRGFGVTALPSDQPQLVEQPG